MHCVNKGYLNPIWRRLQCNREPGNRSFTTVFKAGWDVFFNTDWCILLLRAQRGNKGVGNKTVSSFTEDTFPPFLHPSACVCSWQTPRTCTQQVFPLCLIRIKDRSIRLSMRIKQQVRFITRNNNKQYRCSIKTEKKPCLNPYNVHVTKSRDSWRDACCINVTGCGLFVGLESKMFLLLLDLLAWCFLQICRQIVYNSHVRSHIAYYTSLLTV